MASNKSIDAENKAGSRVLLTQHPRPSLISGHDWRSGKKNKKIEELNAIGQKYRTIRQRDVCSPT